MLVLGSPEGALLVDGGNKARSAAVLKLALKSVNARKLHTLFNTHWHPDQTGGNEYAGKQGARIIVESRQVFGEFVKTETERWGAIAKKVGIPTE